eukprot:jgi/Ulvmu1/5777/UM025_0031.1
MWTNMCISRVHSNARMSPSSRRCGIDRIHSGPTLSHRRRHRCSRRCTVNAEPEKSDKSSGSEPSEAAVAEDKEGYQLPSEVVSRLRDTVFGFDTFFVTSTENYQADGVLFKGNLRGDPAESFKKMERRLKDQLGDKYVLFLLEDQKETPVVVVLPRAAVEFEDSPVASIPVAILFALVTLITALSANGVPFLNAVLTGEIAALSDQIYYQVAAPGTSATLAILAAHEAGHLVAARQVGAQLRVPFLIPAGLGIIGSFGAVTGIKGTLRNREELLKIAAAGPAAGTTLSLALVLVGLGLSAAQAGPLVEVASSAFNDCLLVGVLGQATFGEALYLQPSQQLSPFLLAGWAGVVVNGLNLIPMGELDGGRIAHALWGRRAASRISVVLTLLLGLAGIVDSLALYWILLVLTLQRGPIVPQQQEVTAPADSTAVTVGAGLLFVPLLTLLPFPGDVTAAAF